jgi:hypothetical protein
LTQQRDEPLRLLGQVAHIVVAEERRHLERARGLDQGRQPLRVEEALAAEPHAGIPRRRSAAVVDATLGA